MLSQNLEKTLHHALAASAERRHEYATLEHLLFALCDDADAIAVMRACNVDIEQLRTTVRDFLNDELTELVSPTGEDPKPTAGVQRVVQRAANKLAPAAIAAPTGASAHKGTRKILLEGNEGYVDAQIFERNALAPGQVVRGPAIIEQTDTTTLVEPGWRAEVAANEVLILTLEKPA